MAKDIRFNVKLLVDGKEQLVTAVTTTKQLQLAAKGAKSGFDRLRDSLVTLNQGVETARNSVEVCCG